MTVIQGFNTIEGYVAESGLVCLKQESFQLGHEVIVCIPISVWKTLCDSLDSEIEEFQRDEDMAGQENLDNE